MCHLIFLHEVDSAQEQMKNAEKYVWKQMLNNWQNKNVARNTYKKRFWMSNSLIPAVYF